MGHLMDLEGASHLGNPSRSGTRGAARCERETGDAGGGRKETGLTGGAHALVRERLLWGEAGLAGCGAGSSWAERERCVCGLGAGPSWGEERWARKKKRGREGERFGPREDRKREKKV